jgi:hypothetical protein
LAVVVLAVLPGSSLAWGDAWSNVTPAGEWEFIYPVAQIGGRQFVAFTERRGSSGHLYATSDGRTFTEVTPAAGTWLHVYNAKQAGDLWYFTFADNFQVHATRDGSTFTEVTPAGTWWDIRAEAEIAGRWYYSFLDDTYHRRLFVTDGASPMVEVTPAGAWQDIDFMVQIDGQWVVELDDGSSSALYATGDGTTFTQIASAGTREGIRFLAESDALWWFAFRVAMLDWRLYTTSDGVAFTDVTPPGTWGQIDFRTALGDQMVFSFYDGSGFNVYATGDGSAFTNVTPAGTWPELDFLTLVDGEAHFRLGDSSGRSYVYATSGGTTMVDITPDGPWDWVRFVGETHNGWYYRFGDSANAAYLYRTEDGDAFADVTPPEVWREIQLSTVIGDRAFFVFADSGGDRLFTTRDGVTFDEMALPSGMHFWHFLIEIGGRGYFVLQDDAENTHLYRLGQDAGRRYRVRVIALNKGGERQPGYQVTFYSGPGGTGEVLDTVITGADGVAETRLPNGRYSYVAQKGCYQGAPVDLSVEGGKTVISHKTMVPVTIRVGDNRGRARSGYTVRTYFADGAPQWWRETPDSGQVRFSLDAPGTHQFLVERNRLQGPLYPIEVCGPAEVRYTLAEVIVHLSDETGQDVGGYLVRVRRPDGSVHMYAWARPNGEARLFLMEGQYVYQVGRRGVWEDPLPFTVAPPVGGPGGVADDRQIEHLID